MKSVWIVEKETLCGDGCKVFVGAYATEELAKERCEGSYGSREYREVEVIEPEPSFSWGVKIIHASDSSVIHAAIPVGHIQDYGNSEEAEKSARITYGLQPQTRALVKRVGNGEWKELW